MHRRMVTHNYALPGIYHITLHVAEGTGRQPLGQVEGSLEKPDNTLEGPHVILTPIGEMVREELLTSITAHYSMAVIDSFVIMPEHLHALIIVKEPIVSRSGRPTHLGQVIAGFKKGCNRRYWAMTEQGIPTGKPLATLATPIPAAPVSGGSAAAAPVSGGSPAAAPVSGGSAAAAPVSGGSPAAVRVSDGSPAAVRVSDGSPAAIRVSDGSAAAAPVSGGPAAAAPVSGGPAAAIRVSDGSPVRKRVPSNGTTGRRPLFAGGYCDVMPITAEQLSTQRAYINGNPRSRLLRTSQRATLMPCRGAYVSALTPAALRGYLQRVCLPQHVTPAALAEIECRLLLASSVPSASSASSMPSGSAAGISSPFIALDSYGDRQLLNSRLLPVVCHYRDKAHFDNQKARCLEEAANGAVLVSARIAPGEQEIMNEAMNHGFPVITIADNGFPERYHPSTERIDRCAQGKLLIVTPWQYQYRGKNEQLTIPFCKAMNCVAQALCRQKDDWWKLPVAQMPSGSSVSRMPSGSPTGNNEQ